MNSIWVFLSKNNSFEQKKQDFYIEMVYMTHNETFNRQKGQ